jgi:hypothetical protein
MADGAEHVPPMRNVNRDVLGFLVLEHISAMGYAAGGTA